MFSQFSLPVNAVIFAIAATVVWLSGVRITRYADEFSERFNLSRALMGLLLLAGVTSLPEMATTFTAARNDNPDLAVNNLLGSIAMQVAVLAVADACYGRRALTSVVPDAIVILQGVLNILLLSGVALAVIVGDMPLWGGGYWSWGLVLASIFCFTKLTDAHGRRPWVVEGRIEGERVSRVEEDADADARDFEAHSTQRLVTATILCSALILVAGYVVATAGEVIAQQSGLGSSFVGVAFVAIATSLPEASTAFASIKRGLYTMAISDIMGTNIINIALIFAVDMLAPGAPVLSQVGNFSVVGALVGIIVTALFMMGLAERADKTFFKMGRDSAAVLVVYLGGLIFLYHLRT